MVKKDIKTTIIPRKDTYQNWTATTAGVLALGEFGLDITNNVLKCGDGVSKWIDLPELNKTELSDLGITATSAEINKLDGLTATTAELNYVDGVTSNIQTQLNNKAGKSVATSTANGLMSSTDKSKLDGIAANANNYTHPTYTGKSSGLYKVTVDGTGHVSAATAVSKADITALGIPAQDTTYSAVSSTANGLMTSTDYVKLAGIANNANNYSHPAGSAASKSTGLYKFSTDSTSHIKAVTAVSKADITALGIPAQDTTYSTATSTTAGLVKVGFSTSGKNYAVQLSDGKMYVNVPWTDSNTTYSTATSTTAGLVVAGTYATSASHMFGTDANTYAIGVSSNGVMYGRDTTYSTATTAAAGLMSAADKSKLDGIASGANNYALPVTGASILGGVMVSGISDTNGYSQVLADTNGRLYYKDTNTTYSAATTSKNGLMTSTDKSKLDGIAANANNYSHPTYTSKSSGLYKVTVDGTGHVSAATAVSKADITALGIPGSDTNTHYTTTMYATSASGTTGASTTNGNTYLRLFDDSTARSSIKIVGEGATEVYSLNDGTIKIKSTDNNTTYSAVSSTVNGLMTSSDYVKLAGIEANANKYSHPAGSAASKSSGLYKFSTDSTSHIKAVTAVSKADITALGIPAQDTTYSTATSTTAGLVKIGYTTSGKNYAVQLSDGKMYVNVPWTDNNTTYTTFVGAVSGSGSAGLVPGPASNQGGYFLKGNGGWEAISSSDVTGALGYTPVSSTEGITGLSVSGKVITYTKGDGTTGTITTQDTNTTYSAATTAAAGLMSAADKSKLDGIASGANKYVLPTATSTVFGGVKIGYTTSGKNYAVQLSDGKMYVNVPWTDNNTTYTTFVGAVSGSGSAGLVPGPASNQGGYFLKGNGGWEALTQADVTGALGYTPVSSTEGITGLSVSGKVITYTKGDGTTGTITTQDTNTTYSTATSTTAGLVKVGYTTSGKNYAVQLSDGKMYVNVPWTDTNTTYSAVSSTANGLMTSSDYVKLAGIANNANNYSHPTYTSKASGLYKVTVDGTGHVSAATAVTKADITALGIPGSDTNTTYSAGTGISLSGTTFSNSGVRSVATGGNNGTITVNTGGTSAEVAVKGLGSAAYTASTAYATSGHNHDSTYAAKSHTHNYAAASAAGGAATNALKVNTAITFNDGGAGADSGVTFNGSAAKTISYNTIGAAPKKSGVYFVDGGSSTTAGTWLGSNSEISEYYDGLVVSYKIAVSGASTTTLNINDLGAKTCYLRGTSKLTTQYAVDTMLLLVYNADTGAFYVADYDANTKNSAGTSNKTGTKLYLVGGVSQSSGGVTTYSNTNCYIGTDNCLYSGGVKVLTAHQSLDGYSTLANTIKDLSISGKTITYTKGDGTTGTLTTQDTNTTYSTATSTTAGLVKIGYTTSGKNYAVQLSDGKMYVNVPWTDNNTTYSAATSTANGLMTSTDFSKLAGIASGANKYTHPTYTSKTSGLYKVTVDGTGHVSAATAVAKADITALGIPGQDTTYTTFVGAVSGSGSAGLVPAPQSSEGGYFLKGNGEWEALTKADVTGALGYTPPTTNTTYSTATSTTAGLVKIGYTTSGKNYAVQLSDGKMYVNVPWTDNNTTYSTATSTTAGLVKIGYTTSGKNYAVQLSDGKMYVNVPWTDTNTTYSAVSSTANGLMTSSDYVKLAGIANNANNYSHPTYTSKASGLYKVTVDGTGHVSAATAVTKADITALGIPGSDTNTTYSAGTGISLSGTTFSNSGVRSVSTGGNNGTITVNTGGTSAEVAVKGLGSAAYTASTAYATAGHTHNYLEKTTYEKSAELACGSNGLVCLGKFGAYDTNITIELNCTTSTTYHATIVIHSQNVVANGTGGTVGCYVYDDADNRITPLLSVFRPYGSASRQIEVYANLPGWSKNLVHVQGVALSDGGMTDVLTSVSSIPTSISGKQKVTPVNVLTTNFASISHTHSAATTSATGFMSASDKSKLDGIASGATKVTTDTVSGWGYTKNAGTVTGVKVGSTSYSPSSGVVSLPAYPTVPTSLKNPNAVTIKAGSDTVASYDGSAAKTFTIAACTTAGAFTISDGTTTKVVQLAGKFTDNNTTYSTATSTTAGLVKIGYTTSGKNYAVQLSDGKMYVNVPWTDNNTTYSAATTTTNGLMTSTDKSKLNGIASGANNYALPVTGASILGGVMAPAIGSTTGYTRVLADLDGRLYYQDTNTTYSAGTGISLSGTTFSNSGVRSVATGGNNGTITVNTGGTSAEVAVKGLGSAAYTSSSNYATSGHTHSTYVPNSGAKTISGSTSFTGQVWIGNVTLEAYIQNVASCLIEGTMIAMADGTHKPIEEVQEGDLLKSVDIETGEETTSVCLGMRIGDYKDYYYCLMFDDGSKVKTNWTHDIYNATKGTWTNTDRELELDDEVIKEDGSRIKFAGKIDAVGIPGGKKCYFYDLISSNNCYYADGILFSHTPTKQYTWVTNNSQKAPSELVDLVSSYKNETHRETDLIQNDEYVRKYMKLFHSMTQKENKLKELKNKLSNTDYIVMKLSEGIEATSEMNETVKSRKEWRKIHNECELELDNIYKEANSLKVQYSSIGEDVLLPFMQLRKKFFIESCKQGNEHLEEFKEYYKNNKNNEE